MIISASYKTDIPAFYGEWFINRLDAGFCCMVNPYGRQVYRVSLAPEDVDGFVFWTKNIGPFLARLPAVQAAGFPFVVQYAINGYPRELETAVVDSARAVDHAQSIRSQFGPRALVWRYDTVVFSSLTPYNFHVENFGRLAESLRGATDEVVVSFMQVYKKTKRNLDLVEGLGWSDPDADEKQRLAVELVRIAKANGMKLALCSQPEFLVKDAYEAQCIDARRLEDVGGRKIAAKVKGNRDTCRCYESRDIGDYDTCPHGCIYCYAVANREVARTRFQQHDPRSEFLFQVS